MTKGESEESFCKGMSQCRGSVMYVGVSVYILRVRHLMDQKSNFVSMNGND